MFTATSLAVIVIIGLVFGMLIVKICNKNNKFKTDYDERQEAIRGRGFKYGFYTTLALLAVLLVIDMGEVNLPVEMSVVYFGIMLIAMLVESSYTVWKDAYFGTNSNLKKYSVVLLAITFINALCAIMFTVNGQMVVDGILTSKFINAECAVAFVALGVQYSIKSRQINANDEEDENEES